VPTSRLVARTSLRVTMAWGAAILAAGALMMGLAPAFWVLLVGRMIMGVGAAMFILTTHFWIARLSTRETRARLFSYHQVAGIMGISLGPALGGAVAGLLSWRYAVGLSLITAIVTWIAIPRLPLPPQPKSDSHSGGSGSGPVSLREVIGSGCCNLGFNFSFNGVIFTLVPLFAAQALGLGPAAIGGLMMLGTLQRFGSALVGGNIATRFGTRSAVFLSLFGLGFAALSFVPVTTPLGLLGAISILSWANLGGSFVIAMITDRTPESQWGVTLGLNRTFGDVGAMIAPLMCGFLIDHFGFRTAFAAMSASIFTAGGVGYVLTSGPTGATAPHPVGASKPAEE
jgi:predicted MFS family arabinose efflux permease